MLKPRSGSLVASVVFLLTLTGCTVPPELSAEMLTLALTVGGAVALLLRQGLVAGTWPKRFAIPDPWKSLVAAVFGAASAVLTAKLGGQSWTTSLVTGCSGLVAVLQGIMESTNPSSKTGGAT